MACVSRPLTAVGARDGATMAPRQPAGFLSAILRRKDDSSVVLELPNEMTVFRRSSALILLMAGLVCTLVGCDLAGEEEDLRPLLGSWQAQDLTIDGVSVKAQLDAQYDPLVLTLREGASGGEYFTMIGQVEGTSEDLTVQGTFRLDDNELTLFPNMGPQVEFDSVVPDSSGTQLTLSAEEGASEDLFLEFIRFSLDGAVDRVEVRLSKGSASAIADVGE